MYTLQKYNGPSSRHTCPSCERGRQFVLYVDESGELLSKDVGRCNRESKCGYHYTPKQYYQDHPTFKNITGYKPKPSRKNQKPKESKPTSSIPVDVFKASLKEYDHNKLVLYLRLLFDDSTVNELISTYFIGSSKHWDGSSVFWQVDYTGKVLTGKIMLYNASNGKRVKKPFNHIHWVHSVMKMPDYNLDQCLFGEHLLTDKSKPVAIVESEKTAIIASVYLPQFTWLAVGGLSNLNVQKCQVLLSRKVVLYPDAGCFDKWNKKAKELSSICRISVSRLLEDKTPITDKESGYDLADYLVQFDYQIFQNSVLTDKEEISTQNDTHTPDVQDVYTHESEKNPTHLFYKQPIQEPKEQPKAKSKCIVYKGPDGRIYIPNPFSDKYSVYPCIDAYNSRSSLPSFEKVVPSILDSYFTYSINTKTLIIEHG